ncbi:MAG: hypothetical protein ACT4TC_07500 [Myxococcaceae bacterium]
MSGLLTVSSLREVFKTLLEEAASRQQVEMAQETEFYLVNLLSEFVTVEKLFNAEDKGPEPLAVLYHRALQQEREERIRTLRRLGDVSLYTVGFFGDFLRERVVGPDYYIQMGGAAYEQVASLSPNTGFAIVYRELGARFRPVAAVLEEIAARGLVATGPEGALKVYESWVRSGNHRLEKVLVDSGVVVPKNGMPN